MLGTGKRRIHSRLAKPRRDECAEFCKELPGFCIGGWSCEAGKVGAGVDPTGGDIIV